MYMYIYCDTPLVWVRVVLSFCFLVTWWDSLQKLSLATLILALVMHPVTQTMILWDNLEAVEQDSAKVFSCDRRQGYATITTIIVNTDIAISLFKDVVGDFLFLILLMTLLNS